MTKMALKNKLEILYEDKNLIAINKPAHILTIATRNEKNNTLYHEVSQYLKKQNKSNKVFIIHRLDKETSGIVLFAKNYKSKEIMQKNWTNVKRFYLAILKGVPSNNSDTLKSFLKETRTNYVYSSNKGEEAVTEYKLLQHNNKYSLVKIRIHTGKKHQIRVQFNDIGCPILGEKVYSNMKDREKRLYLHAYYLEFLHPITNKPIKIFSSMPKEFNKYFNYLMSDL